MQHRSVHQYTYQNSDAIYQNSDQTIEKTNTRDQREIKIATPAITMYASILMHSVNTLQNL